MTALQTKRAKLVISGFLRSLDAEESDDHQIQRHHFKQFVGVLEKMNYFKGLEKNTNEYNKKLEEARVTFNKQMKQQNRAIHIETIDVLKFGSGKNKGVVVTAPKLWNKIVANVLKVFESFVVEDEWDKFYSNIALVTDGATIQRITKARHNWFTGFGTEFVKKGETRKWKIKLIGNENNWYGFGSYIGICDAAKCNSKMEGQVSDLNNQQYAMHLYTGNKCNAMRDGKPYARKCTKNDVVEMELNMKGSKKATLKYSINGKDCGVAFDNIDNRKCYKLAISIQKQETYQLL